MIRTAARVMTNAGNTYLLPNTAARMTRRRCVAAFGTSFLPNSEGSRSFVSLNAGRDDSSDGVHVAPTPDIALDGQPLNVTPLIAPSLNEWIPGRAVWQYENKNVCFQVGIAGCFKALCEKILRHVGQFRRFTLDELNSLKRDQMVLCGGSLDDMVLGQEGGPDMSRFSVPNALYRGRLLQDAASGGLKLHKYPQYLEHGYDYDYDCQRLCVELVDIGVHGDVHVSVLMPMPNELIKIPAMALIIGDSTLSILTSCCQDVQDSEFMVHCIYPDRWHKGSSVRRADGLLRFIRPENVEKIPKDVLKLIDANMLFRLEADGSFDGNCVSNLKLLEEMDDESRLESLQ